MLSESRSGSEERSKPPCGDNERQFGPCGHCGRSADVRSSAESESVACERARAPARLTIDRRQSRISFLTGVLGRRERRMPPAVCLRCEAHAADGATSSLRRRGVQCHCRSAAGVVADQASAAPARPCTLAAAVVVGRDFGDVLGLPRARCGDVIGVPALWPGTRHWLRHAIDFDCLPLGDASRIRGSDCDENQSWPMQIAI